jgi:hypothetical protein
MTPDEVNGHERGDAGGRATTPGADEELNRQRAEVASLREQLARVEQERDLYRAELDRVLKEWIPMPPSEAEMEAALRQPMVGSNELAVLIAELEARQEQP